MVIHHRLLLCLAPLGFAAGVLAAEPEGATPPDTLPPPLVAPVIAPPADGPFLQPLAAPAITFEERVLEIVNLERRANGDLPPLKGVAELGASSETHSFNMADRDFFAHCDLDTKTQFGARISAAGYVYNAAAENIAAGYPTPEEVMAGWMASSGHRGNILSSSYREIGIGYHLQGDDQSTVRLDFNFDCDGDDVVNGIPESGHGPYYRYWTQNFGRRNAVYPLVIDLESHDTVCAQLDLYVYGPGSATQMRFSNDGVSWSPWMPYSPETTWTIPGASGSPATVFSEVTNGSTTYEAEDSIVLGGDFPVDATVVLPMQSVSTAETYEACDTLSAVDGFEVTGTGDVTFRAGRLIVLGDGFAVQAGASFEATVDPLL